MRDALAPLELNVTEEYAGWDQRKRDALDVTLAAISARLDARRAGYVQRSSAHEWAVARRNIVAAEQTLRLAAASDLFARLNLRDASMAANGLPGDRLPLRRG